MSRITEEIADEMAEAIAEEKNERARERGCTYCHGIGHHCPECGGDGQDEREECSCDLELTVSELDSGKCAACGKAVLS